MTFLRSIAVFLSTLCVLGIASGQSQEGRILGTVTDQSGGLVKGAHVIITNVDTGVARTLETNDVGDYVAPSLPPGPYKLVVEATGFKRVERSGIRLEVAKDLRLDVTMQPGSVSEVVEVTEQAPLVETTNDTLGGTFANKSINDLPLNGRDFQNLVVLRPGVQRSSGGGFLSISSNGNRPEDNNFIVDGTDNNDPYYATTVINAEGVQGTPTLFKNSTRRKTRPPNMAGSPAQSLISESSPARTTFTGPPTFSSATMPSTRAITLIPRLIQCVACANTSLAGALADRLSRTRLLFLARTKGFARSWRIRRP